MHKIIKQALPYLALMIFVFIIWPKKQSDIPSKDNKANKDNPAPKGLSQKLNRPTKPKFEPKELPDALQPQENKTKTFLVTNPEAIEFNNQDELVLTQGPGRNPKVSETDLKKKTVQSAIEATQNPEKFKSRLSPLHVASKFDKTRFKSDEKYRQNYINNPEPARVWQVDDKSDIKLKRVSNFYLEGYQNEEIPITVIGAPNMPISILSMDLGLIKESGLTHATVLSDSSGSATFTYVSPPGTFGTTNLLVGGQGSASTLKFKVYTKIKPVNEINN